MKFGQNLSRNQVPEWSAFYINYKGLKKLIKSAQRSADADGEPDLAGESHVDAPSVVTLNDQ